MHPLNGAIKKVRARRIDHKLQSGAKPSQAHRRDSKSVHPLSMAQIHRSVDSCASRTKRTAFEACHLMLEVYNARNDKKQLLI